MLSSFSDAANTHCFTAFTAQSERIGFPPSTCTSFTAPFGCTSTRNFTVPPIPLRFSTDGYCAATAFKTFRLEVTSCATLNPALAATNTAHARSPRIFRELFFISLPTFQLCRTGRPVPRHTSGCREKRASPAPHPTLFPPLTPESNYSYLQEIEPVVPSLNSYSHSLSNAPAPTFHFLAQPVSALRFRSPPCDSFLECGGSASAFTH
jgi:hypothetical protein